MTAFFSKDERVKGFPHAPLTLFTLLRLIYRLLSTFFPVLIIC